MERVQLGATDLLVSRLALGASAAGGVFGAVDVEEAVATIVAAYEAGINFFDCAPAYGSTAAETVLGAALRQLPRADVVVSTKVGKLTLPTGQDVFDYSEQAIRRSVADSCERLGVSQRDILLIHDPDSRGANAEQAFSEGLATLAALKAEGKVSAIGAGFYSLPLWKELLCEHKLDVALVPNHHTLVDVRVFELLPLLNSLGVGLVSAAPFGSGLFSGNRLPDWHTAPASVRQAVARASEVAEHLGTSLPELAMSFAANEPQVPVTLFSCGTRAELERNLRWAAGGVNRRAVAQVQLVLEPIMNLAWQD